jgi:hypothetical protein
MGQRRAGIPHGSVIILTELDSGFAMVELLRVASDPPFQDDEIRQAAVWGLGKTGLKVCDALRAFISGSDDNVAMHAIMAHGHDTSAAAIAGLVADLTDADQRRAAAASETLRVISSKDVVKALAAAAEAGSNWIIATLGRMPPGLVREELRGTPLLARIEPLLLLGAQANADVFGEKLHSAPKSTPTSGTGRKPKAGKLVKSAGAGCTSAPTARAPAMTDLEKLACNGGVEDG